MSLVSQALAGFVAVATELKNRAIIKVLGPAAASTGLSDGTIILRSGYPSGPVFVPPPGWYTEPQGVLSASGQTQSKGTLNTVPMLIGPIGWITSGFTCSVTTAFAGGVGAYLRVGLYGSLPDGTIDLAPGPVVQGIIDLSGTVTAGNKIVAWTGSPVLLKPGLYWLMTLYNYSTAPTAGQLNCFNQIVFRPGSPATFAPGTSLRYWSSTPTSFTTLPTTSYLFTASGAQAACIGIIRA